MTPKIVAQALLNQEPQTTNNKESLVKLLKSITVLSIFAFVLTAGAYEVCRDTQVYDPDTQTYKNARVCVEYKNERQSDTSSRSCRERRKCDSVYDPDTQKYYDHCYTYCD